MTGAETWRSSSDGQVAVVRRGNGAGRWFLHDLLLMEPVAGT